MEYWAVCSGKRRDTRATGRSTKPDVAGGAEPDSDRAVNPRIEPALAVDGMQPAPYLVHTDTKRRQRIRLQVYVAKIDGAGSGRANKPVVLPADTRVTHRTLGVVPNRELEGHHATASWTSRVSFRLLALLPFGDRGTIVAERARAWAHLTQEAHQSASNHVFLQTIVNVLTPLLAPN